MTVCQLCDHDLEKLDFYFYFGSFRGGLIGSGDVRYQTLFSLDYMPN